jgi:hypothetical protein
MIFYIAGVVAYLSVGFFIFFLARFLYGFVDEPLDVLEALTSFGELVILAWPIAVAILFIYPLVVRLGEFADWCGRRATYLGGRLKIALKSTEPEKKDE